MLRKTVEWCPGNLLSCIPLSNFSILCTYCSCLSSASCSYFRSLSSFLCRWCSINLCIFSCCSINCFIASWFRSPFLFSNHSSFISWMFFFFFYFFFFFDLSDELSLDSDSELDVLDSVSVSLELLLEFLLFLFLFFFLSFFFFLLMDTTAPDASNKPALLSAFSFQAWNKSSNKIVHLFPLILS